jgi:hypothetical protein
MKTPSKFISETYNFWVLAVVPSSSRPDKSYEIRTSKNDGKTYCTCPGWIFKARKGDGLCKHLLAQKKAKPAEELVVYKWEEFVAVKRGIVLNTGGSVSDEVRRK